MSDNKITQDQLEPNVIEELESGIGDLSTLSTENKDSLVAAVTEIYGKNIIAEAIGEPLAVTDTFSEMGSEINGLLSSFKTNMMNSGVTVESGDKFKQLIEKIKGLTEGEGNKGIQYTKLTGQWEIQSNQSTGNKTISIPLGLDFTPSIIICYFPTYAAYGFGGGAYFYNLSGQQNVIVTNNIPYINAQNSNSKMEITNISSESISISNGFYTPDGEHYYFLGGICTEIYAIGVGEEDTTLRDSLASILQEEGVEVTEEDDMASLITKVDEEFEDTKNTLAELMQKGGYDITGEEGIDSLLELLTAQGITVNDVKQICCGTYHVCIVKKDGSLWSCGNNKYGQLGLGDDNNRTMFNQVTTNINNDVKQIACGQYHTLLLKNDGSLWACGLNDNGQLGLGSTTNYKIFNKVTTNINSDVKEMACGDYHTFILKNDGSLWSCGYNQYSRLGLGDTDDRTTFTQVTTNINNDVKQVVCGKDFTLILKTNGSLWSCGRNDKGQLGLDDTAIRNVFTQVTINVNNDVKQIACGNNHTVILKKDGSLWGCGSYFYGQLGIDAYNTTNGKRALVEIINKDIAILSVNCGGNVTFITLNNGYVLSCGSNGNGQLGINSTSEVKPVFTMSTFKLY